MSIRTDDNMICINATKSATKDNHNYWSLWLSEHVVDRILAAVGGSSRTTGTNFAVGYDEVTTTQGDGGLKGKL